MFWKIREGCGREGRESHGPCYTLETINIRDKSLPKTLPQRSTQSHMTRGPMERASKWDEGESGGECVCVCVLYLYTYTEMIAIARCRFVQMSFLDIQPKSEVLLLLGFAAQHRMFSMT